MWLLYWVKLKIEASISLQYKLRKLSEEHFSLNAVHSRELSSAQTLRGSQRLCPQGQQPDRVLKSWLGTWPGHYGDCSCCKFRYSRRNRKKSGVEEVGLAHNWFSLSSDIASFGQHNCYCEERLKLNKAICVNMPSHRDQTPLHKRGSCRNKMGVFWEKACWCKMKSWVRCTLTGEGGFATCILSMETAGSVANWAVCNALTNFQPRHNYSTFH